MSKNGYLPSPDADRASWLKNFAGKISLYATLLGITVDEIALVVADSAMYSYCLEIVEWFKKESAKRVAYKNLLADGDIGTTLGAFPVTAAPSDPPAAVSAGVFKRTSKLVQRIKNHPAYTVSIGEDLGIEAHDIMVAKLSVKPELKVSLNAGKPVLKWKKGNMVATDLYVDRGDDKGFVFLATAIVPHFTDEAELGNGTKSALWQYKAIYKSGNEQTGEFSSPVSIAVTQRV